MLSCVLCDRRRGFDGIAQETRRFRIADGIALNTRGFCMQSISFVGWGQCASHTNYS